MMPAELEPVWPCWRLWVEHHSTWTELNETMSVNDVMDANDALGFWIKVQNEARKDKA